MRILQESQTSDQFRSELTCFGRNGDRAEDEVRVASRVFREGRQDYIAERRMVGGRANKRGEEEGGEERGVDDDQWTRGRRQGMDDAGDKGERGDEEEGIGRHFEPDQLRVSSGS